MIAAKFARASRTTGLFLCLLAASASAQTFTPTADARVRKGDLNTNYASDDLGVDIADLSANGDFERSLLRFVVSGVDPSTIDCVTLELQVNTTGGDGDVHFEVRLVSGGWNESTVTWSTRPFSNGRRIGAWVGDYLDDGETAHVSLDPDAFAAGDGTYDLVLVEARTGGLERVRFESREDDDPPQLVFGCGGQPARAGFAVDETDGPVPFTPQLRGFLPDDVTSATWDFGDGATSTDLEPTHTYTSPGRYSISLTATSPAGTVTVTRPDYVFAHPADTPAGSVLSFRKVSALSPGGPPIKDNDLFGRAVGNIGDLNGDGTTDLIVGAVGDDDAASDAGAAWILAMNPDGSVKQFTKITEGSAGFTGDLDVFDGFGREVAPIGDLDGDGVLDVAVGANYDDDDGTDAGAVWILFLNPGGTVKSHTKINAASGAPIGLEAGDQFGRGIARLEDMDGDGVIELAVGATNDDDGGSNLGAVWILFLNSDGTVKSSQKISTTTGGLTTPQNSSRFGWWLGMCVSPLGDVDGNGTTDIVAGCLLDDGRELGSGAAIVMLLNPDGTVLADHKIDADIGGLVVGELEANDEFGGNSAGIGDLDGDGIPDLAVASIRDDDSLTGDTDLFYDSGAIFVFFLNSDGTVREYQKISASRGGLGAVVDGGDRIGEGLSSLGDFDGDGVVDLLVGSRFDDTGGLNRGAVFLYHLDNGMGGVAPTAAFDADTSMGVAPLSVQFTDTSSGLVDTWAWDFGDGSGSSLQSPSHVYGAAGTYDVSLTVSSNLGSDTLLETALVQVTDPSANIVLLGCGVNPDESMQLLAGDGSIGTTMTFGLDNPLGTQAPGSLPIITIATSPDPNTPCGTLLPGFGMDGGSGELLIGLNPPPLFSITGAPWNGAGNAAPVNLNVPNNPGLVGATFYVQGRILDSSAGASVTSGLTNAYQVTIPF